MPTSDKMLTYIILKLGLYTRNLDDAASRLQFPCHHQHSQVSDFILKQIYDGNERRCRLIGFTDVHGKLVCYINRAAIVISSRPLRSMREVTIIIRAHGFRVPRNFAPSRGIWFFPRHWAAEFVSFSTVFPRIWRFSFEYLFFHRKGPQSSSVTSLFMMIFCLMVMVALWIMND